MNEEIIQFNREQMSYEDSNAISHGNVNGNYDSLAENRKKYLAKEKLREELMPAEEWYQAHLEKEREMYEDQIPNNLK